MRDRRRVLGPLARDVCATGSGEAAAQACLDVAYPLLALGQSLNVQAVSKTANQTCADAISARLENPCIAESARFQRRTYIGVQRLKLMGGEGQEMSK